MGKGSNVQENKLAGASYIITYYQEVMNLTHAYLNYNNAILFLEHTHKTSDFEGLEDPERQNIIEQCQTVRYYAQKAYVMYKTIIGAMEGAKEDIKIKEAIKPIKKDFIIKRDDIETFVVAMNGALIKDVVKDLLQSSKSLVDGLYSGNETK